MPNIGNANLEAIARSGFVTDDERRVIRWGNDFPDEDETLPEGPEGAYRGHLFKSMADAIDKLSLGCHGWAVVNRFCHNEEDGMEALTGALARARLYHQSMSAADRHLARMDRESLGDRIPREEIVRVWPGSQDAITVLRMPDTSIWAVREFENGSVYVLVNTMSVGYGAYAKTTVFAREVGFFFDDDHEFMWSWDAPTWEQVTAP